MSAPGEIHERLREDLDTLAMLSGHRSPLHLGDWLRPDVARYDVATPRMFVGDAKATETPANVEAIRRLRSYLAPLARATGRGYVATFAVAHYEPSADWPHVLDWLSARLGLEPADRGRDVIATDATVSWIRLASDRRGRSSLGVPRWDV